MSGNAQIWAQKMADVLGKGVQRAAPVAPTNGSPTDGSVAAIKDTGTVTAAPTFDAPVGDPGKQGTGAPTKQGGPPDVGKGTGGGGSGTGGKPAGGGTAGGGTAGGGTSGGKATGGTAQGTGVPAPSGGAGTTAGDDISGYLSDVQFHLTNAKEIQAELKTLTEQIQAAKKQLDDACRQANTAEKELPAVPQIAAPQGKDPKAQYDSAIQITGNVRKVQQDAAAKIDTVRQQQGVGDVISAELEPRIQQAAKEASKSTKPQEDAKYWADRAETVHKQNIQAAAEAKQKYRALNDDHPDRAGLKETYQAYEKTVNAGNAIIAKVRAANQEVIAITKNNGVLAQNIERLKAESQAARDATAKHLTAVDGKLTPFDEAVKKSEAQEADYKSKLSEGDAEAVLKARYEALGGDAELKKALADEDKEYQTQAQKFRTALEDWKRDSLRELDEYEARANLDAQFADIEAMKDWYVWEKVNVGEVLKSAQTSLADKQSTEPVKELMAEIQGLEKQVMNVHEQLLMEKRTELVRESLKFSRDIVDTEHKASEKYLIARSTELNNQLEMNGMSLEKKVDFLQTRPKPVRDRIQKQLEGEIDRIQRLSVAEIKKEAVPPKPKEPVPVPKRIDWATIKAKIEKYSKMDLNALKESEKDLDSMHKEYEKAGGDNALMGKLTGAWKEKVEKSERDELALGGDYRSRSEKLRGDMDKAASNHQALADQLAKLKKEIGDKQAFQIELGSYADPSAAVKANYDLLEAELKRLRIDEANLALKVQAAELHKENAKVLEARERNLFEANSKNMRTDLNKPAWDDVKKMPLRDKFAKLTGKKA